MDLTSEQDEEDKADLSSYISAKRPQGSRLGEVALVTETKRSPGNTALALLGTDSSALLLTHARRVAVAEPVSDHWVPMGLRVPPGQALLFYFFNFCF